MSDDESHEPNAGSFPDTSKTLFRRVLSPEPHEAREALEEFFQSYWYPMYAFMRSQGVNYEDACDLVQGFILRELLERDQIKKWNEGKGRLRTFLKVALDHFRLKEYRRDSAIKNGGPKELTHVSMDFEWAEGRFVNTAIDYASPDKLYEKEWAEATFQQVIAIVARDYAERGKTEEFQLLCANLSGRAGDGERVNYAKIGLALGTNENNVKQKMAKFRDRFRRAMEAVIGETAAAQDIEDEIRFVSGLLSGRPV